MRQGISNVDIKKWTYINVSKWLLQIHRSITLDSRKNNLTVLITSQKSPKKNQGAQTPLKSNKLHFFFLLDLF